MSRKALITGVTDHTPFKAICSECRSLTQHEVLRSVQQKVEDDMDTTISDYQIVICLTCKKPSFRLQVVDTDMYYFDEEKQRIVTPHAVLSYS